MNQCYVATVCHSTFIEITKPCEGLPPHSISHCSQPIIKRSMSETTSDNFKAMEIATTEEKAESCWCHGAAFLQRRTTWLWIVLVVTALTVYCTKQNGKEEVDGNPITNTDATLVNNPLPDSTPSSPNITHNMSFPGMNDTTTILECCSASVIVELERHFNSPIQPFSTLLYNYSHCGDFESVEIYPGCCGMQDNDPFGGLTIPDWVEHCTQGRNDLATNRNPYQYYDFTFYYDGCPATLLWSNRTCQQWMSDDKKDFVKNVTLVNGEFTGMVSSSGFFGNFSSIFLPDVSNSCWLMDCSWGEAEMEDCIQAAKENLHRVSLDEFVNTIKHVWCE